MEQFFRLAEFRGIRFIFAIMLSEKSPTRTILHIDMDAFYASVELLARPDLIGKPVVVGGSPQSRGVVCSASYEARAFGIRSAMPCFKAYKLCPQAIFIPGDYATYGEYSRKLRAIFERFSPLVEMASQDEAYLDLSGSERLQGTPLKVAETLRRTIREETQLPCSIGIGRSKLIAKIASALCKPKGLLWVPTGNEIGFLSPLPVGKIPGVGTEMQRQLHSYGIQTIAELLAASPENFPPPLNKRLWELHQRCTGKHESPVIPHREAKSVSHERTFDVDITNTETLENYLSWLSDKVASRLRAKDVQARKISLKMKYSNFTSQTVDHTLGNPTSDAAVIAEVAKTLLRKRWEAQRPLRLIGVCASGFEHHSEQLELFSELEAPELKARILDHVLDQIREKHGFDSVLRASSKRP